MVGGSADDGRWLKSSYSASAACVEVAFLASGDVLVRHSNDPDGPHLRFSGQEWAAFVAGVRAGELGG